MVKAAAVQRLLRGNGSPSGSRDVKRRGREGGGSVDSPDLNLSVHTESNKANDRSMLRQSIRPLFSII